MIKSITIDFEEACLDELRKRLQPALHPDKNNSPFAKGPNGEETGYFTGIFKSVNDQLDKGGSVKASGTNSDVDPMQAGANALHGLVDLLIKKASK